MESEVVGDSTVNSKGEIDMSKQNGTQELVDYNKNAVKAGFEVLSSVSTQAATAADQILGATPNVPEEGKKVVDLLFKENQKGLENQKKYVETGLEIDWTSQNAPVKSLEALENLSKSAFSQTGAIQKETRELLKKTTDLLPKEAQPVVDFWNEAFNSNFQIFQNFVTKNFELAKKVVADLAAAAPKLETKAAAK
jgi:hypothetical protein